jgi:hypothetical protein
MLRELQEAFRLEKGRANAILLVFQLLPSSEPPPTAFCVSERDTLEIGRNCYRNPAVGNMALIRACDVE